jgi:excisionase family DNA binding protein
VNLLDEGALRALVSEEVRRALREELARAPGQDEFLPVTDAARIAAVHADTIRAWIAMGRLVRYSAGRELRVKRSDLEAFLRSGPAADTDISPEQAARRFIAQRGPRRRPRTAVG